MNDFEIIGQSQGNGTSCLPEGDGGSIDGQCYSDSPDDLTCAICLCQPEPVNLAIIKGCEHSYCGERPLAHADFEC
jgi:hypothetical protein